LIQAQRTFLAAIAFYVLGGLCPALADDHVSVFAGGQLDYSNYVFMGATVAMPGATIGNGFALRGLVDTGGYNYNTTTLGLVKANFGGGELDGVYQLTHGGFWSNFGVGVNDTYTGLTPDDLANRRRGDQVEFRLSLDGGNVSGPWRVDWDGYYGTRLSDYAARLGLTHSLSSQWRLGGEFYAEGDPTYNLYAVGPYFGVSIGPRSEITFSGGESWESGFNSRPYVRALIEQSF
jgi:hypothetical protein